MKEINLEQILFKHWCEWYKDTFGVSDPPDWEGFKEGSSSYFVKAMRDVVEQALELAAERAMIAEDVTGCDDEEDYENKISVTSGSRVRCEHYVQADKQSILDTIKQVI